MPSVLSRPSSRRRRRTAASNGQGQRDQRGREPALGLRASGWLPICEALTTEAGEHLGQRVGPAGDAIRIPRGDRADQPGPLPLPLCRGPRSIANGGRDLLTPTLASGSGQRRGRAQTAASSVRSLSIAPWPSDTISFSDEPKDGSVTVPTIVKPALERTVGRPRTVSPIFLAELMQGQRAELDLVAVRSAVRPLVVGGYHGAALGAPRPAPGRPALSTGQLAEPELGTSQLRVAWSID